MNYTYAYPHPAVTTDIVVFTVENETLKLLLIKRREPPFKDQWALPGGFVRLEESLDACAKRELAEEAGLSGIFLEQLCTFGEPDRDPRERVISVAYYALVPPAGLKPKAGTDASDAAWFDLNDLPELAFDHKSIIEAAQERLTAKMSYSTIGFKFMDDEFTLSEVQALYEIVSAQSLDKRNFRKWILSLGIIEETGGKRSEGAHRPAKLYRVTDAGNIQIVK